MEKEYEKIFYPEKDFPFTIKSSYVAPYELPSQLRNHPEIEIQFIHQGTGFYFIKNRKYHIFKNLILIIYPYEIHNFIPSSSYIHKTTIIFHPKIFSKIQNIEKFLKFNGKHQIFVAEKQANELEIILKKMEKEFQEKGKYWKEIIIFQLFSLILLLNRFSSQSIPVRKKSQINPVVEKAISYIEKNFSQKITLFHIAKIVNCSPYYLSHIFKDNTGMNFKEYLISYRISKAKEILEKNDLKVSAVAMKTGFSSFQSFNYSFKKYTGITPTSYRKFYS